MALPTPHGDKLRALLTNTKLPTADRPRVGAAIERYQAWIDELRQITGAGEALVEPMVSSLNRYKMWIDLNLVFDSERDFLYRQKGQLKLDNTVVEEFMPWLVGRVFAEPLRGQGIVVGPTNTFSQLRFDAGLTRAMPGGGMAIKSKNQDFVLARPLFIRASHRQDFTEAVEATTHLAYVAAEIKTNLDKTMFQEAGATAYDLKLAVPNSRYFLLCEWLDMTPISTAVTAIEEVIILRKAKRLSATVRKRFATAQGRSAARTEFERFLVRHSFVAESFNRFLFHVRALFGDNDEHQDVILGRGWF